MQGVAVTNEAAIEMDICAAYSRPGLQQPELQDVMYDTIQEDTGGDIIDVLYEQLSLESPPGYDSLS